MAVTTVRSPVGCCPSRFVTVLLATGKVMDVKVICSRLDKPVDFFVVGQFVSGAGWQHVRRISNSFELIFVRRGTLPIRIGERSLHVVAGEVALLPPGIEHAGTEPISEELDFFWMHFQLAQWHELGMDDGLPSDESLLALPEKMRLVDPDRLTVLFGQLVDVFSDAASQPDRYGAYCATCILLEVNLQMRRMHEGAGAHSRRKATGVVMLAVCSWIRANAFEPITVAGIAERFHYSPSYLTARYRSEFGVGIVEQIAQCRIDRACELLTSTAASIADIAHEIGYDDPKYFMRVFKRRVGLTPGQYRAAFPRRLFNTQ